MLRMYGHNSLFGFSVTTISFCYYPLNLDAVFNSEQFFTRMVTPSNALLRIAIYYHIHIHITRFDST
jgi:hypothetical protein